MKRLFLLLVPVVILSACGGDSKPGGDLTTLKKKRAELDAKIKAMEAASKDSTGRVTPVFVNELQPQDFKAFIEVQSQVTGDEVVNATGRTVGTIKNVLTHVGQQVRQGQVLATIDASIADQQLKALEPQIDLAKSLYEKQQKLWAQNIGTEVQLMSAKTQYENLLKQKAVAQANKDLYNIVSPISGTVDAVDLKVGDNSMQGRIRVVNTSKLKAEANLGENYIGKVHAGDPAILILADMNDTIHTKVSYVSEAVDPLSRAFLVQVKLDGEKKLHPNMSCILKIANYENPQALVVPVSVIQKTSEGEMIYIADGSKAKAVYVTTGRNANGMVEVTSGLKAGDKVVVAGFEDLDNGENVSIQ